MAQTEARRTLKDAPVMWRRINSIGIITDCNSTYAAGLGYAKSEVIGKSIFEHVPKESWAEMNESLKAWFETGSVADRRITFRRQDGSTFPGLLHATSLYDGRGELLGSNTIIFDLGTLTEETKSECMEFFRKTEERLEEIGRAGLDEGSKPEYDGLREMVRACLSHDIFG